VFYNADVGWLTTKVLLVKLIKQLCGDLNTQEHPILGFFLQGQWSLFPSGAKWEKLVS